jgi:hypothetical protein
MISKEMVRDEVIHTDISKFTQISQYLLREIRILGKQLIAFQSLSPLASPPLGAPLPPTIPSSSAVLGALGRGSPLNPATIKSTDGGIHLACPYVK